MPKTSRAKQPEVEMTHMDVRVPLPVHQRIKALASLQGTTVSALITTLLHDYIKRHGPKQADKLATHL